MALRARSASRAFIVVLALVAAISVAISLAIFAQWQEYERIAWARGVALRGAELRYADPYGAVFLGAIAVRVHKDEYTLSAWEATLVAERRSFLPAAKAINNVALSADGRMALMSDTRNSLSLWELVPATGLEPNLEAVERASFKGRGLGAQVGALSNNGRTAVIASRNGRVSIWDLSKPDSPVEIAVLREDDYRNQVTAIALVPDGSAVLVGYADGSVSVWRVDKEFNARHQGTFRAHPTPIVGIGVSADGSTMVSISKETGLIWDLGGRSQPVRRGELATSEILTGVAVSGDGLTVVTSADNRAHVWDAENHAHPKLISTLPATSGSIHGIALAENGNTMLSNERGGLAVMWNLNDRSLPVRLAKLKVDAKSINSVALSANGQTVFSGTPTAGAYVWNLSGVNSELFKDICNDPRSSQRIEREYWRKLTGEEWSPFLGDQDYFQPCR
jgi:WD40 repeat protein